MSNVIHIKDLTLKDTIYTKQHIDLLSNQINTISVGISNNSSFVNTSISSLSGDVSYLRDDLEFTKQITKNTTKFRLLANKTIISAGTQSDTLTQFMALSSNVGMFSFGKIYETEMITMENIDGIPHIYECIKQTTGTQDVSNTTYWKEITDDVYTKASDEKYYYKYQNDVPAQTQHFITIYSSQPLTAQNIKIDWGDKTITDLYQKTFDDLSDMWESSKENVLNSSKKTAIYVKEPPIKNDMDDDFEVEIHIKHDYSESMSSDIQAFDMTIDGNSYWGLKSDNVNTTNPKNLIDRIWAIGYPFMSGILNTSQLLSNNKRLIQVQLPAYSIFITTLYNISSMFRNCTNLIAVNGFAKRTWFQQLRAITSLFEGCSSLINSDVMIPRMMSHESVMSYIYKNCKRLCRNVNTLFMPNGFIDRKINLTGIFSGCKSLPAGSNFVALRDIMWNDNTKIWNFSSTFGGTSNDFKQTLSSEVDANHSSDISMTELQKMWT